MMNRRTLLRLIPGAAIATTVPTITVANPAPAKFDLKTWLETADPKDVADYHASQLAKTMAKINNYRSWRYEICHEHSFALIVGDRKKD